MGAIESQSDWADKSGRPSGPPKNQSFGLFFRLSGVSYVLQADGFGGQAASSTGPRQRAPRFDFGITWHALNGSRTPTDAFL